MLHPQGHDVFLCGEARRPCERRQFAGRPALHLRCQLEDTVPQRQAQVKVLQAGIRPFGHLREREPCYITAGEDAATSFFDAWNL